MFSCQAAFTNVASSHEKKENCNYFLLDFYILNLLLNYVVNPFFDAVSRPHSLLDFKSEQVAEQMTLLDAELFLKIEVHIVLYKFVIP